MLNCLTKKVKPLLIGEQKPIVFEGIKAEEYKQMRNKWVRLAVIGTGVPFILGILVSIFNNTFDFLALFGKGEIILLLFSLNLPMAFDLFDMKHKKDERLSWAFWACVIIICLQVALYCLIRMDTSASSSIKSLIFSIIMAVASWIECAYSIKAIYFHSIDDGGETNVN